MNEWKRVSFQRYHSQLLILKLRKKSDKKTTEDGSTLLIFLRRDNIQTNKNFITTFKFLVGLIIAS